jgi:hypothetical protein
VRDRGGLDLGAEEAGMISAEGTCLEVEKRFLETRHDDMSLRRVMFGYSRGWRCNVVR